MDAFARGHLSPFVNFHRPSLYATEYVDSKGKVRRKHLRDDVKTPYEKLKSLSGATGHLKPGLTFGALDRIAGAQSDLEAARGAQRGPRRTVPAVSLDRRRGVMDKEPSGPRFPPPAHRRFHVRGTASVDRPWKTL